MFFNQCNKEKNNLEKKYSNNYTNEKGAENFEKILEKQLKEGGNQYALDDERNAISEALKHTFTIDELNASVKTVLEILKLNGYKTPNNNNFNDKINEVFGRLIDPNSNSNKIYLYVNYLNKCDRELKYNSNNRIDFYGTYIVKNENFISDFYYLPQLIDYKKKFPDIADKEKTYPDKWYNDESKVEVGVEKWTDLENRKDEYNLAKLRNFNTQLILARNKYLFNDSKADFTWLKFNDKIFLESLVKIFGDVKDKDLLAFVLENNYKKKEELEKIIWNQKCGGEIMVNKEVFDLAKNWQAKERHDFLMFMTFVVQNMKEKFETNNVLNFSQKAKLLGLISYYATKIGMIDNTNAYSFFPMLSGKNYDDEFKKNNYYNIPDFKTVYEDARTGGVDTDNWVQPDFSLDKTKIPNTDKPIIIYDRADFNSFSTEITVKNEIEYLSKISGWDFIRVDGRVGYIPNEQVFQEIAKTERKKHSFLADDEPLLEKKKGFWDRLFG